MHLNRFVPFIEEKGTALEKARFAWLFHGVEPAAEVIRSLTELQNVDGGFPGRFAIGCSTSTVNDTLRALWWLDDLGLLSSAAASQAFNYLQEVQEEDGGWGEVPAATQMDVPPWASPGDLRAKLYLSAQTAFWFAVGGRQQHPTFGRVLAFLLQHQEESGRFYGFLHTTWIATAVFALAGEDYAIVVERGLRALAARPLSEWVDSQISWALGDLGRAGLPAEEPFIQACLTELERRYQAQGRWVSEDGEAFAVNATLGALSALRYYGRLET